jgi:maleylacetoacetate isomerase/maleylpyruvate isomerase
MKLHGYFRSSTSYRLRIALALKGLDYEYVPVNLIKSEQKDEAFTSRNPFASVPLLEAEGRGRAQSMALIEWLEEAYPAPALLPQDIEDRYTARELAYAIATETHAPNNLQVLNYLKGNFAASQDQIADWYRHWLGRTLTPIEARLRELETDDFLFEAPGIFEVVLLPQMYNARRFELDCGAYDRICQIEAACLALPAFQHAHPDNQPDNPDQTHNPDRTRS